MPSSSPRWIAASRARIWPSARTLMPSPPRWGRECGHQPVGERAERGHADALALEISDGLDRRVEGKHQREVDRRPVHGGNANRRRALGTESQSRPRAQPHVEAAGGERLLHLRIAAKACYLDLDAFLVEDLGLNPDFGRPEGQRIRNRLDEPDLVASEGRPAP